MSISHRTNRLKLIGSPSVEKLQNGRYKLVVTCSTMNSREDWYSANKARIFPDFGSLQSAEMSIDGLSPRTGEAYADMRLTQVESGNRSGMGQVGDYNVSLTYETLGSSFIQVKDDNTDYELNGLRRVTRTSIAEAGTDYAKTVGTSFIDHQIDSETAVICFLASYGIDDTDSFRQVQEVYVEAGTLSETLDNVGSQKAKVIEAIGTDPTTPDGYSLASKQESDFEGFQTNRFTFLKDNVVLSVSEDKVGSQKAVVNEVFNPTSEAITGIDTSGTALVGYSEANRTESDYEGIKTIRVQFLKNSVISVEQQFNNGLKTVSVQVFNITSAEVSAELSAITSAHKLSSQNESNYEGIKTSTFQYQIDESITEDYELNGLKSLSITELSSTNFTARDIGVVGFSATPQAGLYLGAQDIDNGGAIKVRESVWFEAGTLNVQRVSESDGVYRVTTTFLGVEGTVVGPIIAKTEGDFEGLKTITVVSMQDAGGSSLITLNSPVASHSILNEFTYPGVVGISNITLDGTDDTYKFFAKDFSLNPPTVSRVPATIKVSFRTSSSISYSGTNGLWNPTTWAKGTSLGIGWNYAPFSISRGFRGYRIQQGAGVITAYSGVGTQDPYDMISGKRIFLNTNWAISVSGGPPNPAGLTYTLDYSVSLAFEDTSGVPYYKHTEIVATIPPR